MLQRLHAENHKKLHIITRPSNPKPASSIFKYVDSERMLNLKIKPTFAQSLVESVQRDCGVTTIFPK
jgi:hypothetical protein